MRPLMYKVISVRGIKYDRFEDEMLKEFDGSACLDDSYDSRDSRRSRITDVSFESTETTRSQLREDRVRLKSQLVETTYRIAHLERELHLSLDSKIFRFGAQNALGAELDRLRSVNIKLLETNFQLESDKSILTTDLDRLRNRIEAVIAEKTKVTTSAQEKSLASQLKTVAKSYEELTKKYAILETSLKSIAHENATLKKQVRSQDERYAKQISVLASEKRLLEVKLEKSDDLVVSQSQYIHQLQGQIRDINAIILNERDELRGLKDTLRYLKDRLESRKKTKPFYTVLIERIESHLNDEEPAVSATSTQVSENVYASTSLTAARRPLPPRPSAGNSPYEELDIYQEIHGAQ